MKRMCHECKRYGQSRCSRHHQTSRLSFGLPSCVALSRVPCGGGATGRHGHQLLDVQQTEPLFRNSVNYTMAVLIEEHTCIGSENLDLHLLIRNVLRALFLQEHDLGQIELLGNGLLDILCQ